MRKCLEEEGLAVRAAKPGPDDDDAPDRGELITTGAFVAFYSSSDRAEEVAAQVRKNAERARAEVARYDDVTVLYLPNARRAAIEDCVESRQMTRGGSGDLAVRRKHDGQSWRKVGGSFPTPVAMYTTKLSMPLVGLPPDAVLSELRAALAKDARAQAVFRQPEPHDEQEPVEHVSVMVRFSAPSSKAAHQIPSELHDVALQRVLASLPSDHADQGWTSSFQDPELALE